MVFYSLLTFDVHCTLTGQQWRRSKFILRGRNFFPQGEGNEARKVESGDGVLGGAPSPPARGVGEHCKLPQRDPVSGAEPRKI